MARPSRERIDSLLVEDDPGEARLIEEAFGELRMPIDVHTVTDVAAAIEYLERRAASPEGLPDIIFLDLGLPGPSGWTLLDDLKERNLSGVESIPVIVITNSQAQDDMFDSLDDDQVRAYFTKPYNPGEYVDLAQSLVEFLAREQDSHERTSESLS